MKKISILISVVLLFSIVAIVANAAELVNVAEGKTYTVDIGENGTPNYGYTEGTEEGYGDGPNGLRQRLTDGIIAGDDGGSFYEGRAVVGAQSTPEAIIVVDLGSSVSGIKKLNIDMFKNESWDINSPIDVEYFISDDNSTFTSLGTVTIEQAVAKGTGDWSGWDYTLELDEAQTARYIKIKATAENYVWSSEIQVFAEGTNNPDTGDAGVYVVVALLIASVGATTVVISRRGRA